jgi:hypothetical protein
MHGGFLLWGLCLIVLVEEHRDGAEASVAIAEKPAEPGEDAAKIQAWVDGRIEALGDPVYGERAKATRQLIAAGPKVVERLSLALKSQDPEVARRCQHILERVIRSEQAGFQALERVARASGHPSAKIANAIVQGELDRRDRVMAALAEQRLLDARRYLREARAALYQGRFAESREKALAAQSLDISYSLFDDRPDLVLTAIQQAEGRVMATQPKALVTADRE